MAPADSTPDKSPAFQFYVKDFLSDGDQAAMSLLEAGMYIRLMCFEWNKAGKGIPDDPERLARMAGASMGQMRKLWPAVRACFVPHPTTPGYLVHPRLEREREKQANYRQRQSDKGKASAGKRKATKDQPEGTHGSTVVQPDANRTPTGRQPALVQPEGNSAISNLHVPPNPQGGNGCGSHPEDELASDFLERYPEVYAKCRSGASYVTTPANFQRDYEYARALARGWPDLNRLLAMLEIFLRRKDFDAKNIPGTPGQFLNMAPDCDRILREHGR